MMEYFAIIPARAGSKGIPGKNMQMIGEKPLVQYTFEAAFRSRSLGLTILSSDDQSVIELAHKLGIKVPFVRPAHLAEDNSSTVDVIKHCLDWFNTEYHAYPTNIVLLQPTSPFRNSDDIDAAIECYEKSKRDSLVSACETSQHPSECFIVTETQQLKFFKTDASAFKPGRQNYRKAYFLDGATYISTVPRFLRTSSMFDEESAVYIQRKSHSLDIDDFLDLTVARAIERFARDGGEVFNY